MRLRFMFVATVALIAITAFACGEGDSQRGPEPSESSGPPQERPPDPEPASVDNPQGLDVWPQVWSQSSPQGSSYEYKVNCNGNPSTLEPCYLSDLDFVRVIAPDGSVTDLERDFNINDFSGEVTRRWVIYGPSEHGALPEAGEYVYRYLRDGSVVGTQTVHYAPSQISYPTNVEWARTGGDISVSWTPPPEVADGMWYKAIIWNESGTPELFISQEFDWDIATAVMRDVPLVEGGEYSLNVAVYYNEGYAYSEYIPVIWPDSLD